MAFRRLKQMKDAMSPEAIRQGIQAGRDALAAGGAIPEFTEEQLAAMAPEQRAALEANLARARQAQADGQAVIDEALERRRGQQVLRDPLPADHAPRPAGAPSRALDRDEQAAEERSARDDAREPYLASGHPGVQMIRMTTRAGTQAQEVAAYLASSGLAGRPDLVYGVYPVPDHLGGGTGFAKNRVVEWDIVHAAPAALPPTEEPEVVTFDAAERWVLRRVGEPQALDEDLALTYLRQAGVGPERCLGVARAVDISSHGGGEDSGQCVVTQVTGVRVFQPAGTGTRAAEALREQRPIAAMPVDGIHVEVLNWHEIQKAVQPRTGVPFLVPSPFPYLPSTPQELLRSYLEVVGVQPQDCFSAQVTEDRPRDLSDVHRRGIGTVSKNRGTKQPSADGELRARLSGGACLVVAYRDSAVYEEGRARWSAYETEVLSARLANGMTPRRPVENVDHLDRLPGGARQVLRTAERVAAFFEASGSPFEKIPPHRYCWPPQR